MLVTPIIPIRKKDISRLTFPKSNTVFLMRPAIPILSNTRCMRTFQKILLFFGDETENPWWLNIDVPQLAGRIYISYKEIGGRNKFDSLVDDGFKMAYKQHTDVSTGINDSRIQTPNGIGGIYFSLAGNTATANQFFLTDTSKHFLRGALYFDATPNEDSLSVVNDFLKKDLEHLINTLRWKDK